MSIIYLTLTSSAIHLFPSLIFFRFVLDACHAITFSSLCFVAVSFLCVCSRDLRAFIDHIFNLLFLISLYMFDFYRKAIISVVLYSSSHLNEVKAEHLAWRRIHLDVTEHSKPALFRAGTIVSRHYSEPALLWAGSIANIVGATCHSCARYRYISIVGANR